MIYIYGNSRHLVRHFTSCRGAAGSGIQWGGVHDALYTVHLQNLIKLAVRYAAVLGDADERYTVILRHGPNHPAIITPFAHTPTLPQTIKIRFIAALLRHS